MKAAWPAGIAPADPAIGLRRTRLALETVIRRARPATFFYPALLAGYLVLVRDRRVDVIATVIAFGLQLVLALARHAVYRRNAAARDTDPERWRVRIALLAAAVMFVWDGFLMFEVWSRHLDPTAMVLVTSSIVMRSSGTLAISADLAMCRLWSRWSRLPLLVTPFIGAPGESGVLAFAFLAHFAYSESQTRQLNAEFWHGVLMTESLEVAHADLRLAQKLESVGRLAAGIAHEINTPLQAIMGSLELIGDATTTLLDLTSAHRAALAPDLAADVDELAVRLPGSLRIANECLDRTAAIVRSIKAFAHPNVVARGPVDINRALATTLTISRHEWKDIADVTTSYGDLPSVDGFAGELNQVFLNIVVNAAHAMADTRARGTLGITTRAEPDAILVEISDTGCGIPAAIADRIFDPFFTTKDVGRGTGQGLSLAHAVITRRHGGKLTFASSVGRGTTFTIRLPIAAPVALAA